MIRAVLRAFIDWNVRVSMAFDRLLPEVYRVDGNRYFVDSFFRRFLHPQQKVYDMGGGRHPAVPPSLKRQLGLHVVGVDISAQELAGAPEGAYDTTICADITEFSGDESGDVAICQSLLEHVASTDRAFRAISSVLKEGGTALLFAPSRNAVFARLNLLLPESLKRSLLFALYPSARGSQGFRSYYDRCTPIEFERMARTHGLEVVERHLFYCSAYFTFFFPCHVLWRIWIMLFRTLSRERAAETFVYALRRLPAGRT